MKHVYDMSYSEFQIRLFAWKRVQARDWEKVRLLAWHIRGSGYNAPKIMPTLDKFMKLDTDTEDAIGVSDAQKTRFLEEYASYLNILKSK